MDLDTIDEAVEAYGAALPRDDVAEPDFIVYATAVPNDSNYGQLWGMHGAYGINAQVAWNYSTGDGSVVVAVIDSGVQYTHPDLANNRWTNPGEIYGNGVDDDANGYVDDYFGYDFVNDDSDPMDDHGHGTHVAGTIGGVGNNGSGVAGVNWNVRILAAKFLASNGYGPISAAVAATYYCTDQGVKITNNSWGGGGFSSSMKNAIDDAGANEALFIASAGNDSINTDTNPHYPSGYDSANIISVTSMRADGNMAYNYGLTTVDLGAPGYAIYSTDIYDSYSTKWGTSMATPHVAGAAALLKGMLPGYSSAQLKTLLMDSTTPTTSLAGKCVTGGRLDLAVAFANTGLPTYPTGLAVDSVYSNRVDLSWTDTSNNEDGFAVERKAGSLFDLEDESMTGNGSFLKPSYGGPTYGHDGISGYYELDGGSDEFALDSALIQGSSDFSVSVWFNTDSLSGHQAIIEGRDANDDGLRISLSSSGGLLISINQHDYFPSAVLSPSQWYHLSFVADRDGMKRVYLNGQEVFSGSGDSSLSTVSNWKIGRVAYTPTWFFDGKITNVRIYDRLLSGGEVSSLFASGRSSPIDAIATSSLIVFYSMSSESAGWNLISTVPSETLTFPDTTVEVDTTYSYRLRAYNAFGNSGYSGVVTAETLGGGGGGSAPAAPDALAVTSSGATEVSLNWSDNATDEDGFQIERQHGDGGNEGTVSDVSGNGHAGTVEGAVWGSDLSSGYYDLDGVNDSIELDSALLQGSSDFSVSVWFNADSLANHQAILEGRDANDDGLRISLLSSASLAVSINEHDYIPSVILSSGQWYHLAFSADRDGTKRVYLDGQEVFSGSGDSTLSTTSNWRVGRIAYTPAWFFNGKVSNLRVYTRLLTAGEVGSLYAADRGAASEAVSSTGLELFYPMSYPNGPWTQLGTVTSDLTSYDDTTVAANTTYSYRLRAYNAFGNSGYSGVVTAETTGGGGGGSAPAAPDSLVVTASGATEISLNWFDNATDEDGFQIERQHGDGGSEGTVSDSSGNGHAGTVEGAVWGSDLSSGYYDFDGVNDSIELDSALLQGSSDFSVSIWFNADSLANHQAILEGRDANDDGLRISLLSSASLAVSINEHDYIPSVILSSGQWYHLAFSADRDGTKRVYLDGQEVFSGSGDSTLSTTSNWRVGRIAYTPAWFFNGKVSNLRVYTRLLTAGEVGSLYAADRGAASEAVSSTGLELFYPMSYPNGPWTQLGTIGSDLTSYDDATVEANTTYSFRVRAYNAFGSSEYSSIASTQTSDGVSGNAEETLAELDQERMVEGKLRLKLSIENQETFLSDELGIALGQYSTSYLLQWNSASNHVYRVYETDDLVNGFTLSMDRILATPPENKLRVGLGNGNRGKFFFVEVVPATADSK